MKNIIRRNKENIKKNGRKYKESDSEKFNSCEPRSNDKKPKILSTSKEKNKEINKLKNFAKNLNKLSEKIKSGNKNNEKQNIKKNYKEDIKINSNYIKKKEIVNQQVKNLDISYNFYKYNNLNNKYEKLFKKKKLKLNYFTN